MYLSIQVNCLHNIGHFERNDGVALISVGVILDKNADCSIFVTLLDEPSG